MTGTIDTNGQVDFSPASGQWTVYAISQKPSGQKVKRPAPGGEGWMVNLFYPHAVDDFLKPFTTAFDQYTGPNPRAMFQDSYEYRSDWSPVFFAEFEKRRGYRLQDELPALFSQNPDDHAARVLCDYRETISEIMAQESLPKWTQWAHDHGFITRDQAHGSPGNWLDLYAAADIPETEMFHADRNRLVSKFASSAAHVTGKPLVSSETLVPGWRNTSLRNSRTLNIFSTTCSSPASTTCFITASVIRRMRPAGPVGISTPPRK